jgi:hypothetical protein
MSNTFLSLCRERDDPCWKIRKIISILYWYTARAGQLLDTEFSSESEQAGDSDLIAAATAYSLAAPDTSRRSGNRLLVKLETSKNAANAASVGGTKRSGLAQKQALAKAVVPTDEH